VLNDIRNVGLTHLRIGYGDWNQAAAAGRLTFNQVRRVSRLEVHVICGAVRAVSNINKANDRSYSKSPNVTKSTTRETCLNNRTNLLTKRTRRKTPGRTYYESTNLFPTASVSRTSSSGRWTPFILHVRN
jgi:hypothetical protein